MLLVKHEFSFIIAIVLACFVCNSLAELSCLDEDGKPVDWFIGYKFPRLDSDGLFQLGEAYSYITSDDISEDGGDEISNSRNEESESRIFLFRFRELLLKYIGYTGSGGKPAVLSKKQKDKRNSKQLKLNNIKTEWVASNRSIASPDSILMKTLDIAYDTELGKTVSSVFYNDDPTGTDNIEDDSNKSSPNTNRAHAKGVLLMDEQSNDGIWLTHSIPKFPNVRIINPGFPDSGTKNGQTFMCMSFNIKESGKKIIDHLVNMRPLVYETSISDTLYKLFPELNNLAIEEVIKGRRIKVEPKLSQYITTKAGQVLHIFSKSTKFNQDLYAGWIDEEIGSDLYVESWRLGSGNPLNSSCPINEHHINNVENLKYDSTRKWMYSKDHSKWAISEEKDVGVVCIGDSNRMQSQFKRGGGAVCIKCHTCWTIFDNTIQGVEPCPRQNGKKTKAKSSLIANIKQALYL